jgi:hypothetical protein
MTAAPSHLCSPRSLEPTPFSLIGPLTTGPLTHTFWMRTTMCCLLLKVIQPPRMFHRSRSPLFTALHFTLVTQDNQWPTKRYMTYWQPRALPSTNLQGAVVLEEPSNEFETTEILHLLDQIALKYTAETLKQVLSPSQNRCLVLTLQNQDTSGKLHDRAIIRSQTVPCLGSRADPET